MLIPVRLLNWTIGVGIGVATSTSFGTHCAGAGANNSIIWQQILSVHPPFG